MPKTFVRVITRLSTLGALALVTTPAVQAASPPADMSGATLFAQNCSACHQLTGKGIPGAFPALAGDTFVQGPPESVVRLLLNGRGGMPSFRADLDNGQIAAILTHVRSAWGNHASRIEAATVARVRGSQAQDSAARALQAH